MSPFMIQLAQHLANQDDADSATGGLRAPTLRQLEDEFLKALKTGRHDIAGAIAAEVAAMRRDAALAAMDVLTRSNVSGLMTLH